MEDEAEIYDGIRAQFPVTFGKQSKSQTPLELIHNATRRSTVSAASDASNSEPGVKPSTSTSDSKNNAFPTLTSSSKAWLESVRKPNPKSKIGGNLDGGRVIGLSRPLVDEAGPMIGHHNPPPGSYAGDGPEIGPPRPPPGGYVEDDDDGDGLEIGPPRPPQEGDVEDGDEPMVGPPRPPSGQIESDSDDNVDEQDKDDAFRIPVSNEIVLKGHTKVVSALAVDHSGSRVLSGSYDYMVRLYDFGGMNTRMQSFRQL